jgi:hypothetical protein
MTDFIADLKKELPYIKPGEEDDFAIEEAGQDAYPALLDVAFMCNMPVYGGSSKAGDLKTAELKFKELALAQPKHHSGCEYLAMLYGKIGQIGKAVWFQERAITIANLDGVRPCLLLILKRTDSYKDIKAISKV